MCIRDRDDINQIMEKVLYEFPVTMIEFYMPKWVEMLANTHKLKADLIDKIRTLMDGIDTVKDVINTQVSVDSDYIKRCIVEKINMADGSIRVVLDVDDKYYYEMLSELIGENVSSEYQLISVLKEMSRMRKEYTKVLHAMESVRLKGYGAVSYTHLKCFDNYDRPAPEGCAGLLRRKRGGNALYRFAGGGRDTAGELLYIQCGMYAFQRVLYDGKISP